MRIERTEDGYSVYYKNYRGKVYDADYPRGGWQWFIKFGGALILKSTYYYKTTDSALRACKRWIKRLEKVI